MSGRWRGNNVDIATIITSAYGVAQSQVEGVPAWDRRPLHQFDIVATCPAGAGASQIQVMLQAMLADRFGLSAHFGSRVQAVRTLELAKDGPKLKPASHACVDGPAEPGLPPGAHRCGQFYAVRTRAADSGTMVVHYMAQSATTADFVKYFGRMGRVEQPPMVDQTGLAGKYDFDFQYDFVPNLKDADGKPVDQQYKFIQAVQDQLGLVYNEGKLKKVPMPVLIIDRISMPTPN